MPRKIVKEHLECDCGAVDTIETIAETGFRPPDFPVVGCDASSRTIYYWCSKCRAIFEWNPVYYGGRLSNVDTEFWRPVPYAGNLTKEEIAAEYRHVKAKEEQGA